MLPGPQEGRSRHRSGVDSAVTETEPRDSVVLVLSRDDGFFMPFGNTENLAGKCKTRRQLKAEEQLRRRR